jgi:GxxExxY protein
VERRRGESLLDGGPLNRTTGRIVGAAIRVHSTLGPGLLESVYETCLAFELREQGVFVQTQVPVPVVYKGISLDAGYRADMIVEHAIVVDIKSVSRVLPVHKAQVLTYLRLLDCRIGLLLNFYVPVMSDGIRRVVNRL